jgi:hypothetical protein
VTKEPMGTDSSSSTLAVALRRTGERG